MENLKLISASEGTAKLHNKSSPRKYHAFIYRTSGTALYVFDGKNEIVNTGDMLYIPQGSVYEFHALAGTDCRYLCVSFTADIENPSYIHYKSETIPEAQSFLSNIFSLWKIGGVTEKFKCYSLFYGLLSYLAGTESLSYPERKKLNIIDPAIEHLKKHIFDVSFKTDDLHKICGVSDTYFRKIFISKFGVNPHKYIESKRISHAKAILESGDFNTVSELAVSVGYSDPLYFSRVFKRMYGSSPMKLHE